ncbi:hypothetical protein HDU67_003903, partial [Dinochytrium kinnereticum]
MLHTDFVRRYRRVLAPYQESMMVAGLGTSATHKEMVADLSKIKGWGKSRDLLLGHTRVFLFKNALDWLEDRLANGVKSRTTGIDPSERSARPYEVETEIIDTTVSSAFDTRSAKSQSKSFLSRSPSKGSLDEDEEEEDDEFDPPLIHYLRSAALSASSIRANVADFEGSRDHHADLEGMDSSKRPSLLKRSGLKTRDAQETFREKIALLIIAITAILSYIFISIVLGRFICPPTNLFTSSELLSQSNLQRPMVSIGGNVYRIDSIVRSHTGITGVINELALADGYLGRDVSRLFWASRASCSRFAVPSDWAPSPWAILNRTGSFVHGLRPMSSSGRDFVAEMEPLRVGRLALNCETKFRSSEVNA